MSDEEQQQINEARQLVESEKRRRVEGYWADEQMLRQKWSVIVEPVPVITPQGTISAEIRIAAN